MWSEGMGIGQILHQLHFTNAFSHHLFQPVNYIFVNRVKLMLASIRKHSDAANCSPCITVCTVHSPTHTHYELSLASSFVCLLVCLPWNTFCSRKTNDAICCIWIQFASLQPSHQPATATPTVTGQLADTPTHGLPIHRLDNSLMPL